MHVSAQRAGTLASLLYKVEKSSVRLSVCLSICTFGMLIAQLCQHGLKPDLFEMKAESLYITMYILQAYSTYHSLAGVPRRRRCKQPLICKATGQV